MAHSPDGPLLHPQLPDFSAHNGPFSSAGELKLYTQSLLESKEKQLQQVAVLGQQVLAQQEELDRRIRELQQFDFERADEDDVDPETLERYHELAEDIVKWEEENAHLSSVFGPGKRVTNGTLPSPAIPPANLPREESERSRTSANTSAAQSRRAKNAAHRAEDVEFAFEIGSGLLTEVRRLQSLLGERDKALSDLREEQVDLQAQLERLATTLRQSEATTEKYKEENWNLEVRLQEATAKRDEYQSSTQRLESEQKRLTKVLATSRDTAEQHRNEAERLQSTIEEIKAKHETDIAQARKHAAGLARDKSDLQQTIDTMKLEAARAGRKLPRFGSPLTPNGPGASDLLTPAGRTEGEDIYAMGGASTNRRRMDNSGMFPDLASEMLDSPEDSPVRSAFLAPNHPNNEIEALQQRLAHAQRQINTLKGTLQREKQLKIDYRNQLEGLSPGSIKEVEEDEQENEVDDELGEQKPPRRVTPFKVGRGRGRGRGRGGISLIQRLGMAAHSPGSEYNDDEEYHESSPPPVPTIPIRFSRTEDDEGDTLFGNKQDLQDLEEEVDRPARSPSPSPLESASNRTSVDGMDPAFANVLRRVPSNGSSYTGSPLRHAVLGRSTRGGSVGRRSRGGVSYKEPRPASLVDAPDVLAAELGAGGSPMKGIDIPEETDIMKEFMDIETAEFGCQTESIEEPVPAPITPPEPEVIPQPVIPPVETAEIGIQSEPEPIPIPEAKPILAEMSIQTDEIPIVDIPKSDIGIQHEESVPPVPIRVSSGMSTDPEPEPVRPVMVQTEVQTSPEFLEFDVQTPLPLPRPRLPSNVSDFTGNRRTTITQYDMSSASINSPVGDTTITIPRTFLAPPGAYDEEDELEDGAETETGVETETDDDYHDARQSILMTTPSHSESRDDFHSVLTMTDNELSDGSDDDDVESIKASRLPSAMDASSIAGGRTSAASFYSIPAGPPATYDSVGVSTDALPSPEPVTVTVKVPVEVPTTTAKPELKEMSIQTDEWKPTVNLPQGFGLYRVGASPEAKHQFQFVAPPPASASSQTTTNVVNGATPTPIITPIPTPTSSVFHPPIPATFSRARTSTSDRRQSIESAISSIADDAPRSRVPSGVVTLPIVDKTRPPMMVLPPPPRAPPPPTAMPPPPFIPERRHPSDLPPPRPSSPPPAELIQRATTPTFGSVLNVPSRVVRQHGSMPPSQANIRQPPSTSSFRSAAHAQQHSLMPSSTLSSISGRDREFSQTSFTSDRSFHSPRSSVSSDHTPFHARAMTEPVTPEKSADITPRALQAPGMGPGGSTDPAIIHAITQTMIGEFLYKYTRRPIGKGHGDKRHQRFFWVHPYTKTLYWSSADPGSSNASESSAKSAYIEGVRSVLDPNPMPPGLYQYSVVVSTPQREMKITAPTKERHDIWVNALKYLLSRPNPGSVTSPANNQVPQSPASVDFTDEDHRHAIQSSPQSMRSARSPRRGEPWNTTPRGQRSRSQLSVGGSIGKRAGTPAAEYLRFNSAVDSPYSPSRSFVDVPPQDPEDLDFELHDHSLSDEGFEGLENVRACCDGRHTVGRSGKPDHHHHHHHHLHNGDHLEAHTLHEPAARPVSPAWSFRSRAGSTHSHEGGGTGIFSWGRGEDGKLRFGSRRSKMAPSHDS